MTTARYSGPNTRPRQPAMLPHVPDSRPRDIHQHDVEIRAGLRGQKCELRAPLRLLANFGQVGYLTDCSNGERERWQFGQAFAPRQDSYTLTTEELITRCPYGPRGTELRVREWWANTAQEGETPHMLYRADLPTRDERIAAAAQNVHWINNVELRPVGPRLVYRIVDIWIDRLQPMDALQLRNEGWLDSRIVRATPRQINDSRDAFANSWDKSSLDEAYRWKTNPWIWVMSVARVRS
jgi:hypothetical protein